MHPTIGIDFGTTNSLCAWLDGDRPSLIPNSRGVRFTPSVVAVSPKGEILVGESAKNQALVNPENTIAGVKRYLGSGSLLVMGGRSWRPEELAALILGSLRKDAEAFLATGIERAVITAPAHFSERERRALVEAGRLAGLEVRRVVNEPTAAAVARAWAAGADRPASGRGQEPRRNRAGSRDVILVYDFGGGTFDVTVLAQEGSECAVLASRGDARLGGGDLDREIRRLAASAFRTEHGLDVDADRLLAQTLSDAAERAKIELSERGEAIIGIPFAVAGGSPDGTGGRIVHPSLSLGREAFEDLARPFVERSLRLTELAIAEAGIDPSAVSALVLSGGSSRIPLVRRLIEERLGLKPEGRINPEEIVALGAAAWTGLESGPERLSVVDVTSRTYGVEIDGGTFVPLIGRNSPVPIRKSRVFTTVADDQDSVEIHVLQGESAAASEDLSLGRFLLVGLKPAPKGEPRIRVDFCIDESDMLHVGAVDMDTGTEQAISIAELDREDGTESTEEVGRKIGLLARRLGELREGLVLERGLEAELDEACARALAISPVGGGGAAGDRGAARAGEGRGGADGEAALRLLKAELEGLVGELLARRAERRQP